MLTDSLTTHGGAALFVAALFVAALIVAALFVPRGIVPKQGLRATPHPSVVVKWAFFICHQLSGFTRV